MNRVFTAALVVVTCTWACSTYTGLDFELGSIGAGGSGASGDANGGSPAVSASGTGGDNRAMGGTAPVAVGGGADTTAGAGGILLTTEAGAPSAGADPGATAPPGIDVAEETSNVVRTGSEPSVRFTDRCPAGQVLIGLNGTIDAAGGAVYLRSVQGVCGTLQVSETAPWQVTIASGATLPLHDQEFPQPQTALCPAGQVVTAFAGRSGLWIDGLEVRCAALEIASDALSIGTAAAAGYLGAKSGGSAFAVQACPDGTVAVGQTGGTVLSGDVLGEFGVICAAVSLL